MLRKAKLAWWDYFERCSSIRTYSDALQELDYSTSFVLQIWSGLVLMTFLWRKALNLDNILSHSESEILYVLREVVETCDVRATVLQRRKFCCFETRVAIYAWSPPFVKSLEGLASDSRVLWERAGTFPFLPELGSQNIFFVRTHWKCRHGKWYGWLI